MSQPNQHSPLKRPEPGDVQALFNSGSSRNEIATKLAVSTRQVDNVAAELGIRFNTELTAQAVTTRVSRANSERLALAEKFRKIADLELQSATDELTTPDERRTRITTAAIGADKDLAIAKYFAEHHPSTPEKSEGVRILNEMFGKLRPREGGAVDRDAE